MITLTATHTASELRNEIGTIDGLLKGCWSFDPSTFRTMRERSKLVKAAGQSFSDLPAGAKAVDVNGDGLTCVSVPFGQLTAKWVTALERSTFGQPLRALTLVVRQRMDFDNPAILLPIAGLLARFPKVQKLDIRASSDICFGHSRYAEVFSQIEELNVRAHRVTGAGLRHYFPRIKSLGIDAEISNADFTGLCRGEWCELNSLHLPQIASADGSRDDESYSARSGNTVLVHTLVEGTPNLRILLGHFRPGSMLALADHGGLPGVARLDVLRRSVLTVDDLEALSGAVPSVEELRLFGKVQAETLSPAEVPLRKARALVLNGDLPASAIETVGAISAGLIQAHVTVTDINQTFAHLFEGRLYSNLDRLFAVYSGAINESDLVALIRLHAPRLTHLGLRKAGTREWRTISLGESCECSNRR